MFILPLAQHVCQTSKCIFFFQFHQHQGSIPLQVRVLPRLSSSRYSSINWQNLAACCGDIVLEFSVLLRRGGGRSQRTGFIYSAAAAALCITRSTVIIRVLLYMTMIHSFTLLSLLQQWYAHLPSSQQKTSYLVTLSPTHEIALVIGFEYACL